MAVRLLAEELRREYIDKKLIISTVTATGNKVAKGIAKEGDLLTYLPLDLSFIVRGVINRTNPSLFIIAETEIWPNLISCLYKKNIPIIVVNGRISDNSFRGYHAIKFFLRPVLNKITLFLVQTWRDQERLISLGVAQEKIRITGNMKFDTSAASEPRPSGWGKEKPLNINAERSRSIDFQDYRASKKDFTDYRKKLGLQEKDKLLVAGSTHPGEEEIILRAYKELKINFTDLKLLIAPRHPERSEDIAEISWRLGFRSVFVSKDSIACSTCITNQVFILDVVGELVLFYAISDIVFVGGSLVKKGGHNILEPAILGKPVIFGPHMFNFRDITDLFLENNAAVLVNNEEELMLAIKNLLLEPKRKEELSGKAKELVLQNQGATKNNISAIKELSYA